MCSIKTTQRQRHFIQSETTREISVAEQKRTNKAVHRTLTNTYNEKNYRTCTFSYTHISNGYFYLSVKVFPHAWKMFNYFCVSYRGTEARHIYITDISFKKCVQTRTRPSYIYTLAGPPLFHLQAKIRMPFLNLTKQNRPPVGTV